MKKRGLWWLVLISILIISISGISLGAKIKWTMSSGDGPQVDAPETYCVFVPSGTIDTAETSKTQQAASEVYNAIYAHYLDKIVLHPEPDPLASLYKTWVSSSGCYRGWDTCDSVGTNDYKRFACTDGTWNCRTPTCSYDKGTGTWDIYCVGMDCGTDRGVSCGTCSSGSCVAGQCIGCGATGQSCTSGADCCSNLCVEVSFGVKQCQPSCDPPNNRKWCSQTGLSPDGICVGTNPGSECYNGGGICDSGSLLYEACTISTCGHTLSNNDACMSGAGTQFVANAMCTDDYVSYGDYGQCLVGPVCKNQSNFLFSWFSSCKNGDLCDSDGGTNFQADGVVYNGHGVPNCCTQDDCVGAPSQEAEGHSCCHNGQIMLDGEIQGSLICSNGGIYDCSGQVTLGNGCEYLSDIPSGSCITKEGKYCVGTNWVSLSKKPDTCSCTAGSDCLSGTCINVGGGGFCGYCSAAYDSYSHVACSNDIFPLTDSRSGECARDYAGTYSCDKDEVAKPFYAGKRYNDCYELENGAPTSLNVQCDPDVDPLFSAQGVCAWGSGSASRDTVNCIESEYCMDNNNFVRSECSLCGDLKTCFTNVQWAYGVMYDNDVGKCCGNTCDPTNPTCCDIGDCTPPATCTGGKCSQCTKDSECPTCQYCNGGTCQAQTPGMDNKNECPGNLGICAGDFCNGLGTGCDMKKNLPVNPCGTCMWCDGTSYSCKPQASTQDNFGDCPATAGPCAGANCDGNGACQYSGVSQPAACDVCKYCTGSSYDCKMVTFGIDTYSDCGTSWTGCPAPCLKTGKDGNCDGAGACNSGVSVPVAAGNTCNTAVGSGESSGDCNSARQCSSAVLTDNVYGIGFGFYTPGTCDDSGYCDRSGTDIAGTGDADATSCECRAAGTQGNCNDGLSSCWMPGTVTPTASNKCCQVGDNQCETGKGYCQNGVYTTDGDKTQPICNCIKGNTPSKWIYGGESAPFGQYGTGTSIGCCSDDIGEYYQASNYPIGNAAKCCDQDFDCVINNICVTSGFADTGNTYCCYGNSFLDSTKDLSCTTNSVGKTCYSGPIDTCQAGGWGCSYSTTTICDSSKECTSCGATTEKCVFVSGAYDWAVQVLETECSDGHDNNCDGNCDYDSTICSHGDSNCRVQVTNALASKTNPIENTPISITCTVNPSNIQLNSIFAYIDQNKDGKYNPLETKCNGAQTWDSFSGKVTIQSCNVGSAGNKWVGCSVYNDSIREGLDRSYQFGGDVNQVINVQSSVCATYSNEGSCTDTGICDWVRKCRLNPEPYWSGYIITAPDIGICVTQGTTVTYSCSKLYCGEQCSDSEPENCDALTGCSASVPPMNFNVYECQASCTCSATVHDPDEQKSYCEGCGKNWAIGGEVSATICCGDDNNEFKLTKQCTSGCASSSIDDACCSQNNNCVDASTCYDNGVCNGALKCNAGSWVNHCGNSVLDCSEQCEQNSDCIGSLATCVGCTCQCTPNCDNKCGGADDGCGGKCDDICTAPAICKTGTCCTPDCTGLCGGGVDPVCETVCSNPCTTGTCCGQQCKVPKTCLDLGKECGGPYDDGACGTVSCGGCTCGYCDAAGQCNQYFSEAGMCLDNIDNDCTTECDYDYGNCGATTKGDNDCPVGIDNIAVSDLSPIAGSTVTVTCTATVGNVNSVDASIAGVGPCSFTKWSGPKDAEFSCNVGAAGSKVVTCSIDTTRSYKTGSDQTRTINVRASDCTGYVVGPTYPDPITSCNNDPRCDWCPECNANPGKYSGAVGRCVDDGQCNSFICRQNKCGATCDNDVGGCTWPSTCALGSTCQCLCGDSDGGKDYYTTGTTAKGTTTATDTCSGVGKLTEYFCNEGNIDSEVVDCPVGTGCNNGKCFNCPGIPPPPCVGGQLVSGGRDAFNCEKQEICIPPECTNGICCDTTTSPYKFKDAGTECDSEDVCDGTRLCANTVCDGVGNCDVKDGCVECSTFSKINDCGVTTGACQIQAGNDKCVYTNSNPECTCDKYCDASFNCVPVGPGSDCERNYDQCIALGNPPAACPCHTTVTECI